MTLPAMTSNCLLPQGRHLASLDEFRARFVDESPEPWDRILTFRALEIHLGLMVDLIGHGSVWIAGDFCSHRTGGGCRPLVVAWCRDAAHLERAVLVPGALERLSLRGVTTRHPVALETRVLRPMGGLVDAYLASPAMTSFFEGACSRVSGEPGMMQGYVEVKL